MHPRTEASLSCLLLLLAGTARAQGSDWAFRPPVRPPVPAVAGCDNPIDAFISERALEAGLELAPRADDAALVRRLSLDVRGLPATADDLRGLRAGSGHAAWSHLVDQMLASPAHAERQAAVWLDLARYADSKGYGSDPLRTIWRYRDWVIEAYEQNLPFDEFTILQMAGDLLPGATWREQLPTAFHRNTKTNTEGGTDNEEFRVEAVRDRVDTTMLVWMGLTVGCAKCHDHKYDPISQREYYELFDVFNHTADADRDNDDPRIDTPTAGDAAERAARAAALEALRAELDAASQGRAAARRDWEDQRRVLEQGFRPIAVELASAREGARLDVTDDGLAVVVDTPSPRDTFALEGAAPSGGVQTLRIDFEPDPERGLLGVAPGHGNIVVSELRVGLRRAAPGPVRGRRIRVDLPGSQRILSLAEVEVLDATGGSLTEGAAARQSSVAFDGPAALAIDGDPNGAHADGSVTHTATEDGPWWEVDLGRERDIASIRVWNRTDGDLEARLRGFVVTVFDDAGEPVWATAPRDEPRPSSTFELGSDAVQWRRVVAPAATFEQKDWGVARAVDGDQSTGWAVAPEFGRAQSMSVRVEPPIPASSAGDRLVVEVVQDYGQHHIASRLRLASHAADVPVLPAAVAAALAVAEPDRSADQADALAAHHARVDPELARLRAAVDAAKRRLADVPVVQTPVLVALPADEHRSTHVMRRGNFLSPGEQVSAAVPAVFHRPETGGPLDRLAFAQWLVDRRNPLTARVQVNRIWARLFGRGLVATEEDFGTQGARPSHPDLLDWLAVEFMESGWDQRHVWRLILGSETYRRSVVASAADRMRDPENLLLARGPRVRLEAEMVRDQALSLAGLLSDERFGPSVFPYQPDGLWQAAFNGQRTWRTSEGRDRHRRALYTFYRRSSPYPSMTAFDAPTREICTPRRIRTNTPLQAFVTLNDPVFVEAAQGLARRILAEGGRTAAARADWALRTVLLREGTQDERAVIQELHAESAAAWRS
ncbi:MAG: DUF1553 domain-containing protein, partial [Planctomycetota bacterium]|nr:DUF1553 domain-containing protein [Planctomycetota bacterium]